MSWIVEHEAWLRLGCFLGVFGAVGLAEWLSPQRELTVSKVLRWTNNLILVTLNTVLVRMLFPAAVVGMAVLAEARGWGVLNNVDLPAGLALLLAVVVLDGVIYLQHVMFHAVPLLWRLHMMHHADLDIDVTTGARFHPIEILMSIFIKLAAVVLLGASPVAVIIFEILLNATAMFNHGNLRLPLRVDRALRLFLVTPDMHRVHHSVVVRETNSNFGFNLPWWDYIFGTYRAQPEAGHRGMTIGLKQFRTPALQRVDKMLALPFTGATGDYAVNRRGGG